MIAIKHGAGLAALAACLGLSFLGCGATGPGAGGDGREAAARFLEELRAGRIDPAWRGTTPEFKSLMGLESLRDFVKAHPPLKGPAEYIEARDAARDGRPMVEHVFRAEGRLRGKAVASTVKVLVAVAGDRSWGVEHVSVE